MNAVAPSVATSGELVSGWRCDPGRQASQAVVMRLRPDGTFDSKFAGAGVAAFPFQGGSGAMSKGGSSRATGTPAYSHAPPPSSRITSPMAPDSGAGRGRDATPPRGFRIGPVLRGQGLDVTSRYRPIGKDAPSSCLK